MLRILNASNGFFMFIISRNLNSFEISIPTLFGEEITVYECCRKLDPFENRVLPKISKCEIVT